MLSSFIQILPKWALLGLLSLAVVVVGYGIFLSAKCEQTQFFGMAFGRDGCDANGADDGNMTAWNRSERFQVEIADEIDNAARSVFMSGTSFYISVGDGVKDAALIGKKFRYVFLDPGTSDEALEEVANFFGQASVELRGGLDKTFGELRGIFCDLKQQGLSGSLEVRLVDGFVGSRLYFFDPPTEEEGSETENVSAYVVPYVNGTDSSNLPGFRVSGDAARSYWQAAEKVWGSAVPWKPEDGNPCRTPN